MIRHFGKELDRDVAVEFIGARPGEKLKEELWGDGETSTATRIPRSSALRRRPSTLSGSRGSRRS